MTRKQIARLIVLILVFVFLIASASAYQETTLASGMEGESVQKLQQALIDQGYLSGTADGKFGVNTENAVRKFQRAHGLRADGLAGAKTQALLFSGGNNSSQEQSSSGTKSENTDSGSSSRPSLRYGDKGDDVKSLQQSLITLGYLTGTADGIYGKQTQTAVYRFQKDHHLTKDGIAGAKTRAAVADSVSGSGNSGSSADTSAAPVALNPSISAPSKSEIKLLHWFEDIKPNLKSKQKLLIYDPATGLSWTLRVHSRGRHCDAEPLTLADTQTMLQAFGGKNTWNQKGVYVQLPSGTWTVGATHDMPHMTGTISDNGFDGHLCVHFLRDMSECEKNDPNYGVSNQRTIRELWRKLTGEIIDT